jgi:hypothetical protein
LKVSKKTDEIDFEAYIILPTFEWNREYRAIDGSQKRTFFGIPCFFSLTNQENLFILELSFIIGLGIKLKTLEN